MKPGCLRIAALAAAAAISAAHAEPSGPSRNLVSYTLPPAPTDLPAPPPRRTLPALDHDRLVLHAAPGAPASGDCRSRTRPCDLQHAARQAALVARAPVASRSVEVRLSGGRYALEQTWRLTPELGGDAARGTRISYVGPTRGEQAVISGGRALKSAFVPVRTTQGVQALAACTPGLSLTTRAIWIDGQPAVRARAAFAPHAYRRSPAIDSGAPPVVEQGISGPITNDVVGARAGTQRDGIELHGDSLAGVPFAALSHEKRLDVRFRNGLSSQIVPISSITRRENSPFGEGPSLLLRPQDIAFWRAVLDWNDGVVPVMEATFAENAEAFLDEAGEFYIKENGCGAGVAQLMYAPVNKREAARLISGRAEVIAPVLQTIVALDGVGAPHGAGRETNTIIPAAMRPIENIDFRSVVFAHASFDFRDDDEVHVGEGASRTKIYFNGYTDTSQTIMMAPRQDGLNMANLDSFRTETFFLFSTATPNLGASTSIRPERPFPAMVLDTKRYREAFVPSAVRIRTSRGVHVGSSVFRDMTVSALAYEGGARDVIVDGNLFQDIGGNALRISSATVLDHHPYCAIYPGSTDPVGPPPGRKGDAYTPFHDCDVEQSAASNGGVTSPLEHADIVVNENRIERPGQEFHAGVGVSILAARNATVARNDVIAGPYTGVWVGFHYGYFDQEDLGYGVTWASEATGGQGMSFGDAPWNYKKRPFGYAHRTILGDNLISHNYLDVMRELDDGGGVFVQSLQPNSRIIGNYVLAPPRDGSREPYELFARYSGIYLDEGASGFIVAHNASQGLQFGVMLSTLFKEMNFGVRSAQNWSDQQSEPLTAYEQRDRLGAGREIDRTTGGPYDPLVYIDAENLRNGYDACRSDVNTTGNWYPCGHAKRTEQNLMRYIPNPSNILEDVRLFDRAAPPPSVRTIHRKAGAREAFPASRHSRPITSNTDAS